MFLARRRWLTSASPRSICSIRSTAPPAFSRRLGAAVAMVAVAVVAIISVVAVVAVVAGAAAAGVAGAAAAVSTSGTVPKPLGSAT